MAVWREIYTFDAEFPISFPLRTGPAIVHALGSPHYAGPVESLAIGTFSPRTLGVSLTLSSSAMLLSWEFEDLFSDEKLGPFHSDSCIQASQREQMLVLPSSVGSVDPGIRVFPLETATRFLAPVVLRLAVFSRSPYVHLQFWEHDTSKVTVRVHGSSLVFTKRHSMALRPVVEPLALTEERIKHALATTPFGYEQFVAIADIRLKDNDLRGAITLLATALETASYAFFLNVGGTGEPPNFKPKLYLHGERLRVPQRCLVLFRRRRRTDTPMSIYFTKRGIFPRYRDVCELWDTRSRILHSGELKVRPDRPASPLVTHADYYRYWEALSLAFEWMGLAPIQ